MKLFTVLLLTLSMFFFAACPDKSATDAGAESAEAAAPIEVAPIPEDKALEAADEILKEIDSIE